MKVELKLVLKFEFSAAAARFSFSQLSWTPAYAVCCLPRAHRQQLPDLSNWKSKQNKAGKLFSERKWRKKAMKKNFKLWGSNLRIIEIVWDLFGSASEVEQGKAENETRIRQVWRYPKYRDFVTFETAKNYTKARMNLYAVGELKWFSSPSFGHGRSKLWFLDIKGWFLWCKVKVKRKRPRRL